MYNTINHDTFIHTHVNYVQAEFGPKSFLFGASNFSVNYIITKRINYLLTG